MQIFIPCYSSSNGENGIVLVLSSGSTYPKNEVSIVKEFIILNSFQDTTLAVEILSSVTLKRQSSILKHLEYFAIILGINLTFVQATEPN